MLKNYEKAKLETTIENLKLENSKLKSMVTYYKVKLDTLEKAYKIRFEERKKENDKLYVYLEKVAEILKEGIKTGHSEMELPKRSEKHKEKEKK